MVGISQIDNISNSLEQLVSYGNLIWPTFPLEKVEISSFSQHRIKNFMGESKSLLLFIQFLPLVFFSYFYHCHFLLFVFFYYYLVHCSIYPQSM